MAYRFFVSTIEVMNFIFGFYFSSYIVLQGVFPVYKSKPSWDTLQVKMILLTISGAIYANFMEIVPPKLHPIAVHSLIFFILQKSAKS